MGAVQYDEFDRGVVITETTGYLWCLFLGKPEDYPQYNIIKTEAGRYLVYCRAERYSGTSCGQRNVPVLNADTPNVSSEISL